jgi:FixJ family two-component response regulator
MQSTPSTVFIVDDDTAFCRALTRLLTAAGYPVEAYGSAREFLAGWRREAPGCLLLDVRMPELSGLEVQEILGSSEDELSLPIVFMSGHADVQSCRWAMRGGATDYLVKPFKEEELIAAVDRSIAYDRVARREHEAVRELRARLAALTPREQQVFRLVAKGMLNKQIAIVLGTREGTVKMHRGHVMRKLELGSVAELVALAHRLRLEDPCPSLHALAGRFQPASASA